LIFTYNGKSIRYDRNNPWIPIGFSGRYHLPIHAVRPGCLQHDRWRFPLHGHTGTIPWQAYNLGDLCQGIVSMFRKGQAFISSHESDEPAKTRGNNLKQG